MNIENNIKNKKQLPLVVIFGRTNVGKSTLFNCLTESRQALTSDVEGTTRDANRSTVNWREAIFELCDTGGIIDLAHFAQEIKKISLRAASGKEIQLKVEDQARLLLRQADLILFLADNKSGLTREDRLMVGILRKILPEKMDHVLLVANKVDSRTQAARASEFSRLGLGEPLLISAASGAGTGDMLDIILDKLPKAKKPSFAKATEGEPSYASSAAEALEDKSEDKKATEGEKNEEIKILIVGKPNVGKSSLLNSILGEERVIVSPIPHTTREPQDTLLEYGGKTFRLVDTAGISRAGRQKVFKDKISDKLIKFGIAKTLGRLREVDLAIMVLDASAPLTHQDAHIAEEIVSAGKGLLIAANKWDLIKEKNTKNFTSLIYGKLPFIAWAPIQFTSALTGAKVKNILDLALTINEERRRSLTDKEADNFLKMVVKVHRPSKGKGAKYPRLYDFKQIAIRPPRFSVRIGSKEDLHFSYIRFMMNRLRDKYGFNGTPIIIEVEKNKRVHGSHQ